MPDISDALKKLDAIAALVGGKIPPTVSSAGIEQQQPTISLADLDQELAALKALADRTIARTRQLDAEAEQAAQSTETM